MSATSRAVRRQLVLALTSILVVGLVGCGARAPSSSETSESDEIELAATELPEIALIGGAQDIWPFAFGLDASRTAVESELGPSAKTEISPVGSESTAMIAKWTYPGVVLTFFVDEQAGIEQLLSAEILSDDIELRGGLELGMATVDVVRLLGEPGLRADDMLVYFYYATTIGISVAADRVSAVTLSRAMP